MEKNDNSLQWARSDMHDFVVLVTGQVEFGLMWLPTVTKYPTENDCC